MVEIEKVIEVPVGTNVEEIERNLYTTSEVADMVVRLSANLDREAAERRAGQRA